MLALYRSGRHAEALTAYSDACAALDEIGLQPGPELRQLEEAILRHDSSLRAPDRLTEAGADVAAVSRRARRCTQSAPAGRRKVVTALFCDVAGLDDLW